ncbi:hypothetical protein D3C83_89290 [compost metagenome]
MPSAAVAGMPTKSIAAAIPASAFAASGAAVFTSSFAPIFFAASSLAGSMSQATMFFTPFARSTEMPTRPRPPQPSTAMRSLAPGGGSLAMAL